MFEAPLSLYAFATVVGTLAAGLSTSHVPLANVPADVAEAARAAMPGANLEAASRGFQRNRGYWALTGHDERGRPLRVELTTLGQVRRTVVQKLKFDLPERMLMDMTARDVLEGVDYVLEIREPATGLHEYEFFGQLPRGGGFGVRFVARLQQGPRP